MKVHTENISSLRKKGLLLLVLMTLVFLVYLVIGMALPVLPLHVYQTLGMSTFIVGLVVGFQFAATLVSRIWAGTFADKNGAKRAILIGLFVAVVSGLFYLSSFYLSASPRGSILLLLVGRALLGGAESFITIGSLSYGLSLLGSQHSGKIMSWVGCAMYSAYALGAPLGTICYEHYGFLSLAFLTTLLPAVALGLGSALTAVVSEPQQQKSQPLGNLKNVIWRPGLGLAFASVGFGAVTTFISLLFAQQQWGMVWLAFTALSTTFLLARIVLGSLPDRIGGVKIALICILIEASGQLLIWSADKAVVALLGAALTGLGYSLIYPGFGVEIVRQVPSHNRALAMGLYTACLDLALGLTGPVLGLIASGINLKAVFFFSTLMVLASAIVAIWLLGVRIPFPLNLVTKR